MKNLVNLTDNENLLLELKKLVKLSKLFLVLFDLESFSKTHQITDFEEKSSLALKECVKVFYPDLHELESRIQEFDEFIVSNGSQLLKQKDSEIASVIFDYFLYKEKLFVLTKSDAKTKSDEE